MMTKAIRVTTALFALLLASGCGETREMLGLNKSAPDEFAVYSRAPLSLPPDYGLRPPDPGALRQQKVEPRRDAEKAIRGASVGSQPQVAQVEVSTGVQALLKKAGAESAEAGIRSLINRETSILAEEDQTVTERMMFWGTKTVYGTVVDPVREAKRIQDNMALGRPINEGEVPTIKRKRKALLEGIF